MLTINSVDAELELVVRLGWSYIQVMISQGNR